VGEANRGEVDGEDAAEAVAEMLELIGLGSLTKERVFQRAVSENLRLRDSVTVSVRASESRAAGLLEQREQARAAKDFERADAIRDELSELGWEVRDSAEGPRLIPKA
jgi:cysteinyl-tRNA synthetase